MSQCIQIAPRREFQAKDLWEIHRLRAKVFKGRLGWEIPTIGGMEIDGYDALDPYYMVIRGKEGRIQGSWRLLPTEGLYMLKNTFPELLHGRPAPQDPRAWELSRFAIETEGRQNFGFAELALEAMREIVLFGDRMGIERYVTVTTTAIERLLVRTGVKTTRFGPHMRIGVENAIALDIDLGEQTHQALFGRMPEVA